MAECRDFLSHLPEFRSPSLPPAPLPPAKINRMNTSPTIPTRVVSALPDGTALARYCMTLGESRGDTHRALLIAERWRDSPTVRATIELITKAAVAPGTTSDATWAGPLAEHGIAGEALQLLRGSSVLGALEGRFRKVPFRTSVPRERAPARAAAGWGKPGSRPLRRLPLIW